MLALAPIQAAETLAEAPTSFPLRLRTHGGGLCTA